MSDLLLDLADIVIAVFEVDLLDGYDLAGLVVDCFVHRPERACAELLEEGVLLGEIRGWGHVRCCCWLSLIYS